MTRQEPRRRVVVDRAGLSAYILYVAAAAVLVVVALVALAAWSVWAAARWILRRFRE